MKRIQIKCSLVLNLFLIGSSAFSQITYNSLDKNDPKAILEWQKQIGDVWFNDRVDSMGVIGEKVPNLPLTPISNNTTGKKMLYDLKGKLIILDFWTTGCHSCIEAFPKMEKMQKELGDQVQILLVNPIETQKKIDSISAFRKRNFNNPIKMPNLPSLTGPRPDIMKLLPIRAVPHHAWINGESILILNGSFLNNKIDKIKKFLNDGVVDVMNDDANTPHYRGWQSLYQLMGDRINPEEYNYFFYPYNKYISAQHPWFVKNKIDSVKKTVRTTYVNVDLFDFLQDFFSQKIKPATDRLIISPNAGAESGFDQFLDLFHFQVADTLRYTSKFLSFSRLTDAEYTNNRFSYEQIVPYNWPEEKRRQHILRDLNDYFGKLYGAKISLERRKIPSYSIVRTSKIDKVSTQKYTAPIKESIEAGKKMKLFTGLSLNYILTESIEGSPIEKVFKTEESGVMYWLIDKTGFNNKRFELIMPDKSEIKSLENLRNVLKKYDLDIIKDETELEFVTIKENSMRQ